MNVLLQKFLSFVGRSYGFDHLVTRVAQTTLALEVEFGARPRVSDDFHRHATPEARERLRVLLNQHEVAVGHLKDFVNELNRRDP